MKRAIRIAPGERIVFTANRLLDGHIVWLGKDDTWHPSIAHARMFDADTYTTTFEQLQDRAGDDRIVGLYEVAVRPASPPEPTSVRERIRAFGPTVHPEFATEIES